MATSQAAILLAEMNDRIVELCRENAELKAERARLREALANLERTAGIPTMYDDPVRVAARKEAEG